MRVIGSIVDASESTRFGDYLTSIKIANTIEPGTTGFLVWVHDDDQLERAGGELRLFNANPADAKYADAPKIARQVIAQQEQKQRSLQQNYIEYRTHFASMARKPAPVTIGLIVICALVAAFTKLGDQPEPLFDWLCFGRLTDAQVEQMHQTPRGPVHRSRFGEVRLFPIGSEDILHGQVWRLFTPMFMHFGVLHLLFNMMWLFDLGGQIERRRGILLFLAIVLISALVGNIAQFYWHGPSFGGMSGVVYGLFGYVWIKSIIQPATGLTISKQNIAIMLGWMVLCMTGLIGPIANAAHVCGLLTGMVLAHAPFSWNKMLRARRALKQGH